MVDAVREAPRILLQVKGREKSAEKRVARGKKRRETKEFDSLLFFVEQQEESGEGRERERGSCSLSLSHFPLSRIDSLTPPPPGKKEKKLEHNMSSARRTSPRRGGAVTNDLRARPGQADAAVSFVCLSEGERAKERERERGAMRQRRVAPTTPTTNAADTLIPRLSCPSRDDQGCLVEAPPCSKYTRAHGGLSRSRAKGSFEAATTLPSFLMKRTRAGEKKRFLLPPPLCSAAFFETRETNPPFEPESPLEALSSLRRSALWSQFTPLLWG